MPSRGASYIPMLLPLFRTRADKVGCYSIRVFGAHCNIDGLLLAAQGLQPCGHPPGIPLLLVPAPSTAASRHSAAYGCHTHSLPYTQRETDHKGGFSAHWQVPSQKLLLEHATCATSGCDAHLLFVTMLTGFPACQTLGCMPHVHEALSEGRGLQTCTTYVL